MHSLQRLNSGTPLLTPAVTRTVMAWMTVVEKGSGKGVKTPGYRIAAKPDGPESTNGFICLEPRSAVCGDLPVEDLGYVVLVVVDEPQGAHAYGSTVAVPVAKKIIDALLVVEKVTLPNLQN